MCDHRYLDLVDGLLCTRKDPHPRDPAGGHTYESSTGSSVPDPHTEGPDD